MKRLLIAVLMCSVMIMAACSGGESLTWYETKEEAIQEGVISEGAGGYAVLSVEEYDGETFIFYEYNDALGVASIAESDKGYAWYRSSAYYGFEGDSPIHTIGFQTETYSRFEVAVIAGAVNDSAITSVHVAGGEPLDIHGPSGFFYLIHDGTVELTEVEAVEG
ncbi:hypothetical protein JSY36_09655 [Bacillus sp. H-16]|uniref:hypothetical protein n=1 Tax=Alteribacter salitolerans TaxID=2912333 RepID=UPI001965504E|nr:hypothetical protein [Alteribacter salitolerans]MBM7096021.1 hypothetical protein [Alteribacter salitolerans]